MSITGTSCTHIGRRENNEDSTCVDEELGLFAVADGIGGYAGGEIASQLAVETMQELASASVSSRAIRSATGPPTAVEVAVFTTATSTRPAKGARKASSQACTAVRACNSGSAYVRH